MFDIFTSVDVHQPTSRSCVLACSTLALPWPRTQTPADDASSLDYRRTVSAIHPLNRLVLHLVSSTDVLQRLAPIKPLTSGAVPSKDHILGRDTRHVLKHIFPRQFGLRHPFDATKGQKYNAYKFEDYTVREDEIQVCLTSYS